MSTNTNVKSAALIALADLVNVKTESSAANANSITYQEMLDVYDERYNELMRMDKSDLVRMIIGERHHVGLSIG